MNIAIISDIHDNIWNLRKVLQHVKDTEALICCGDLCSPFVVGILARGYAGPIHIVFGNNDGDLYRITEQAAKFDHVHLHGEFAELQLGGRKIAVTHFPEIARGLVYHFAYDVVCYGHNHSFKIGQSADALLLNPGCVMGYNPVSDEDVPASFILYDSEANLAEGYQLTEAGVAAMK